MTIAAEFVLFSMLQFCFDLGLETLRDVFDGFGEGEVVFCFQASFSLGQASGLLLVELAFDLPAKFISTLGDGQLDVFPHALLEFPGLATQLLLDVNLELLCDVLLQS